MATTIDSKVVEMKFDNQQFETGISQSLLSLDKLKSALKFDNLGNSVNKIAADVGAVSSSFTSMGIIAKRVLENIADIAFSTGASFVKSMSIGQVVAGWEKYAEITTSTQTIMAATKKDWKDQGEQMKYVNGQLEKLNWYTDETSYNLVDMTSNIGKFTSAGVKLDDATNAMMGVASWAAISGSNVQQASRAMYNLSQAMGMGALRVQDWMSIENANMATKEFKEIAIQTAYELGTLKKAADGAFYTFDKKGNKVIVTAENFRSTLSSEWLSSKVLTKTLKKYGDFATDMHKYTEETGLSATQMLKYVGQIKNGTLKITENIGNVVNVYRDAKGKTHKDIMPIVKDTAELKRISEETGVSTDDLREALTKLSSKYNDLGYNAFKAAQEAKTFKEAVDYSKDALSTGWMNTFRTIFGNYMESKDLWTKMTEEMYDVFIEDIDNQNLVLKQWGDLGGREQLLKGVSNLWRSIKLVLMTIKETVRDVFPVKTAVDLWDMAHNFKEATNDLYIKTRQFAKLLKSTLTPVLTGIKNIFSGIKTIANSAKEAFKEVFPPATAATIQSIANSFGIFASALQGKMEIFSKTVKNTLVPLLTGIKTVIGSVTKAFKALRLAFEAVFTPGRQTIVEGIAKAFEKIAKVFEINNDRAKKLQRIFQGLFSVIDIIRMAIVAILKPFADLTGQTDGLVDGVLDLSAGFGDWLTALAKTIRETDLFGQIVDGVTGFVKGLIDYANKLSIALTGLPLKDVFNIIKDNALAALKSIGKFFGIFSSSDADNTQKLSINLKSIFDAIKKGLEGLKQAWQKLKPYIDQFIEQMGKTFTMKLPSWEEFTDGFTKGGALTIVSGAIYLIYKLINALIDFLVIDPHRLVKSISEIGDGITGTFDEMQKRLQAGILTKLSRALLRLAVSIVAISMVDADRLAASVAAITVMFTELAGMLKFMDETVGKEDSAKLALIGKALKSVGMAMLEMSAAVALISNSKGDVVGSAVALGVMLAAVGEFLNIMNKASLDPKTTKVITSAVKGISFAMIEISVALALLAKANKDTSKMATAAVALSAMMGAIGVMIKTLGESNIDPAKVTAMGAAMTGIGFALIEIAAAVAIITKAAKDPIQLAAGVAALSAMLLAVAVAVNNMPKNLAGIAAGLMLVGVALIMIASSIAIVANLNPDNIVSGMEALVALLAAVTIALAALSQMKGGVLEGAAALTVASIGMLLMANALKVLSEVKDFSAITIMGAALLVLIGAAALAEKVTPGLFALAGAIAIIGAGTALAGAGILMIAKAITMLIGAGQQGVDVVVYAMASVSKLLPLTLAKLAEGIVAFIRVLVDSGSTILQGVTLFFKTILEAIKLLIPLILEIIKGIVVGILDVLITIMPKLLEFLGVLIIGVCELIIKSAPKIAEAIIVVTKEFLRSLREIVPDLTSTFFFILTDTLRQIRDNIEEIVKLSVEIGILTITGFIKGIRDQIPNIVETGWTFVISLINGVSEGIEKHAKELRDAMIRLATAMINAFKTFLGINSPSTIFEGFGGNIIAGLVNGIKENAKKAWEAAKKLASDIASKIKEKFGQFKELASTAINNMKDGFTFAATAVVNKAKEIGGKIKEKFEEMVNKFKEIGSNLINAIKDGLIAAKDKLVNGAKAVGDTVIGAIKKVFKIKSPSRVFIEIGKYLDEGLAIGLENYAYKAENATDDVGESVVNSMSSVLSKVADLVNDEMDADPTIRPVLDLTDVTNGVNAIDGMLSADRSVKLASYSSGSISSSMSQQMALQSMFDNLKNTLSNLASDGGTVNNNTFNITGDDPKAIADEVSRILNNKTERRDAAWAL